MSTFAEGRCRREHENALPALGERFDQHFGDLHVLDVAFIRRSVLPAHAHANARITFVISGSVSETYDECAIDCRANTLTYHPAMMPHRNETGCDDARTIIIEAAGERGREMLSLVNAGIVPFATRQPRLRDVAVELSHALRNRDSSRSLMVESLTLDLVARASRSIALQCEPRPVPPFFDEALAIIESNLGHRIPLAAVATRLRVKPRDLANAFRLYAQTTFRAYVVDRRVTLATVLLRDRDMKIADAAVAAGFCDQSHLTRVFRRVTGLTPLEFRGVQKA